MNQIFNFQNISKFSPKHHPEAPSMDSACSGQKSLLLRSSFFRQFLFSRECSPPVENFCYRDECVCSSQMPKTCLVFVARNKFDLILVPVNIPHSTAWSGCVYKSSINFQMSFVRTQAVTIFCDLYNLFWFLFLLFGHLISNSKQCERLVR